MNTRKRNRILLVSCAVILLCVSIIAGTTYALFSEAVTVKNHLQAADLDISLNRVYLKYSVLNEDGELEETENTDKVDFTTTDFADKNIFGIDGKDILIVPGTYFTADLEIVNNGDVAFNYSVSLHLIGNTENHLADQLKVTIVHADGTTTTKMLNELNAGLSIETGKMKATDASQTFTVMVEFVDDVEVNNENTPKEEWINNNSAQEGTVEFDLVISAVQATDKT